MQRSQQYVSLLLTGVNTMSNVCQILHQKGHKGRCCCNCRYHLEDMWHCTTTPKPKRVEEHKIGECVCGKHKGWICAPEIGERYSGWTEHGICELHALGCDSCAYQVVSELDKLTLLCEFKHREFPSIGEECVSFELRQIGEAYSVRSK